MKCILCGGEGGYNRAVMDLFSGSRIGQLCMNCEKDEFGNTLEYRTGGEDRTCLLCQRDGQVAFPRYTPETRLEGNHVVFTSVIEDGRGPCLCDEHFHLVTETDKPKNIAKR